MLTQKLRPVVAAACVALAGGVALRAQPGDPPAPRDKAAPREVIDEAARKEIAALRARVEALEKGQERPAPARQKVILTSPEEKDVVVTRRYAAQVRAHRHIEVRAVMNGIVEKVAVDEGQAVKKGDVLLNTLPILYRAKLDAEQAEGKLAQIEFDNAKKIYEQKVISRTEVMLYEAKLARAMAKVKLAEAELNFTTVRAPFDGTVGRPEKQAGSVVKEGDELTTLTDNSVLWVYFNVPENHFVEYLDSREPIKMGMPVELVQANGDKFPQTGKLAAIEGRFDDKSETVPFRADFPNPKGLLRHGQTGTVVLHESLKSAVVIPQRATFELLGRRYVYVVGQDDVARRREVVVRNELENGFVVKIGLGADERIVLEGVPQVREGEKLVGYEFRRPGS